MGKDEEGTIHTLNAYKEVIVLGCFLARVFWRTLRQC
jgi:hypothetical protein